MACFLYKDYKVNAGNIWDGLFKSSLLVSAFKHIFTSPSSVDREPRATRSGNARIHGMKKVTVPSLAYVATQVRFALSSSPTFSRTDLVTDSERFYSSVIEAFTAPEYAERVSDLLVWWDARHQDQRELQVASEVPEQPAHQEALDLVDVEGSSDTDSAITATLTSNSSQSHRHPESEDEGAELRCKVQRLDRQLKANKSSAKRMKDDIKSLKEKIVELEEELEDKELEIQRLNKSEVQYRNWWLNEIQFTKLLLNKIPDPNRDIDLSNDFTASFSRLGSLPSSKASSSTPTKLRPRWQHPSGSSSGDLLDLVQVGQGASITTIYPTPDNTRIGSHHLVVVNPYKALASANDANMNLKEYEEKGWRDTAARGVVGGRMQPHAYEPALKMYYARRKKEAQGAISRGLTSSGKSTTFRLLTNELLSLSSHTRKETSLASQVKHTLTVLDAFGNSKSPRNDNASRHARFLSLHFTPSKGRIAGPKFVTFNLDKSRLSTKLRAEERTFRIFYQFVNGATAEEHDYFGLEDLGDYKLLSSSRCYRLSSATRTFLGPDDSIGTVETRASLAALNFEPKHLSSIFTLLTSILLDNLEVTYQDEGVAQRSSQAYVTNPTVLAQAARLLGVGEEELSAVLTTRMRWIRKESVGVILDDEQSAAQRDRCMRDLYAVLFAYIIESCRHRLSASLPQQTSPSSANATLDVLSQTIPIFILDQPGYQTQTSNRTSMGTAPLVGSPYGSNSYEEFAINFADEVVNSFISQRSFEPSLGFNSILTDENVGSAVSGRCGRSGSISGHSAMNVQGAIGSEVLASDELVQLLRGNPSIEPTPVSASGKKLGGVLGVIAHASHNWKTGKSGLIDEGKGEAADKKDGETIDGVLEAFGDRCKGLFGVDKSTVGLLGGSPVSGSHVKTTFFVNRFSSPTPPPTLSPTSRDGFVSRLVSGPGVATEHHARDDNLVVQSQVLGRGLREVTPVLSGETYARIAEAKGETSSGSDSSTAPAASSGPLGGSLTIAEDELTKVYEGRLGRMDPSKTYSLLSQVNQSVSEVLWAFGKVANPPSLHLAAGGASPFEAPVLPEVGSELDSPGSIIKSAGNRLFMITHIRPNDSISPNSFDKRRVRLQLAAFAIPSLVQRLHRNDWSVAIDRNVFVERYVGRMRGSVNERVTQISRAEGWTIGEDAWWLHSSNATSFDGESEDNVFAEGAVEEEGHVFLTYDTWKSVEDRVRAAEKDGKGGPAGYGGYEGDDDEMSAEYTHSGPGEGQMLLGVPAGYAGGFGGSNDNLLGQGGAGMSMPDAATYGPGGLTSPGLAPAYPGSPIVSERGGGDRGFPPKNSNNFPSGDVKVEEAPNAVEQIPSTRTRKWWLRTMWARTWLIPSFLLSSVGRMKHPDVRLAWREKVTIVWLVFLFNGIVIFYIVVFGRLLCPEYDKAWTLDEVAGHHGDNDIFIAVRGVVYDVTDFIKGNHAQGQTMRSNDRDTIEQLAGADMTYYFPLPLPLACPFLVADDANIQLEYENFTPPAIHTSGSNGATDDLKDPEWYKNRSNDSIGMAKTHASLAALGFKPKRLSSILTLLTPILLLGNLEFAYQDEGVTQPSSQAYVTNPTILAQAARLLGMRWIGKESIGVLLGDEQSAAQRDRCMRNLFTVLFAYVIESCNRRLSASLPQPTTPSSPSSTLDVLLQTIPSLRLTSLDCNSYEEFTVNFAAEVVNSFFSQRSFEPSVGFNSILTNENTGKSSLLDESNGEAVDNKDGEVIDGILEAFGDRCKGLFSVDESTPLFVAPPTTYSVANFVEKDADLLDISFLTLLRSGRDGLVSRLVSGPGVAMEHHARDGNFVVQSQVLGRGLRDVTPILAGETYAHVAEAKGKTSSGSDSSTAPAASRIAYHRRRRIDEGVRASRRCFGHSARSSTPPGLHLTAGGASPFEAPVLPELASELDSPGSIIKSAGNQLFTIAHIRPNDSISPNSFEKGRVRLQLAAFASPYLLECCC
ncbi:P-loop containing nucleoside triphosphate hydrolase protein [Coprinopsis sp. MPI-PUGE-AT-0042]|nr:P-loop containing nucleoside triphosphate hydrolase protein [Coprinopsis sp. MPI-PUGE-AT-0042]